MVPRSESPATILVVDDDPGINDLLGDTLRGFGYLTLHAYDGLQAVEMLESQPVDLVITDVIMPKMDGFELCARVKRRTSEHFTPVIILTGSNNREDRIHGLDLGADEFVTKPFDAVELKVRVRSLLRLKSLFDELESAELVLFTLASTVAAKDPYTKGHCQRIAHNAVVVGVEMGLSQAELRAIQRGGYLHDIGKIGVPDAILQKTSPLTKEEFQIMMEHTVRGEEICRPLKTLAPALPIIRSHHERMDGTGYPDGLKGEAIPLGARIVAAVDLFDALITDRPYRSGLSRPDTVTKIHQAAESGHLDPNVVAVLAKIVRDSPELILTGWPT